MTSPSPVRYTALPLTALANIISTRTQQIETFLSDNKLPQPSFTAAYAPDFLPPSNPEIQAARHELQEATRALNELVTGQKRFLIEKSLFGPVQAFAFQCLAHWNIAASVPVTGSISYEDLAAKSGMPIDPLRRVIRFLATSHFFTEATPGFVSHTPMSAELATDNKAASWLKHVSHNLPAIASEISAIERWPALDHASKTGMAIAEGWPAGDTVFDVLARDEERSRTFDNAMEYASQAAGGSVSAAMAGFDWSLLGSAATIVDVGGGNGHWARSFAQELEHTRWIVQDLASVVEAAPASCEGDATLGGRVAYLAHSFFEPQPIRGADAYYYRRVFHDWPDAQARPILQALVPSMASGARLFIGDAVVPAAGSVGRAREEMLRLASLHLMVGLNGVERELAEWKKLVSDAVGDALQFESAGPMLVVFKKV